MRFIVVPPLLVALALCAPVRADEAGRDLGVLRACLSKASGDERSCLGRISDPCQNEPEGSTTPGSAACFNREEAAWDKVLNERYAAAVAEAKETDGRLREANAGTGGQAVLDALRKAQRAWVAFRDAECERIYALNQEGTIRSIAASACSRDLTAERAIGLAAADR